MLQASTASLGLLLLLGCLGLFFYTSSGLLGSLQMSGQLTGRSRTLMRDYGLRQRAKHILLGRPLSATPHLSKSCVACCMHCKQPVLSGTLHATLACCLHSLSVRALLICVRIAASKDFLEHFLKSVKCTIVNIQSQGIGSLHNCACRQVQAGVARAGGADTWSHISSQSGAGPEEEAGSNRSLSGGLPGGQGSERGSQGVAGLPP